MKKVLISSYSMDIGGIERSLVSMLQNFNYDDYKIDLMLYKHEGELIDLIDNRVNLLNEIEGYNTFGISIDNLIKDRKYYSAITRSTAKVISIIKQKFNKIDDIGYYQAQLMRYLTEKKFTKIDEEYDVAISYYWPHYFIANKVKAKKKIAWIHTDYSTIFVNKKLDLKMWSKFDYIISISDDCTKAFLDAYPQLRSRVIVIENIISSKFIKYMAKEEITEKLDKSNFNIVTVGRLCHAKAIDSAIEAFRILENRGIKNIKWYVVGYGNDEHKLKEMIYKYNLHDKFILLGKKINPYPYMNLCDLYVQPSRYEGKAVTITEAQVLGKAVLITNYPTAKSQINNTIDGLITELSIEGIANGIEELIRDNELREKLSNNCKKNDYSNTYELEKLYEIIERG